MGAKQSLKSVLQWLLARQGYEVVERSLLYRWQRVPPSEACFRPTPLPAGAAEYLRDDHPRLEQLRREYADFDGRVTTPLVWTADQVKPDDIRYFRGDNAYVWQLRGRTMNELGYALATYYVRSLDVGGLLDILTEDEAFGNFTFQIAGKTVSRDLLDSILEIAFLERNLAISKRPGLRVLDIGAGYGRLAHRVTTALSNVSSYLCTDAYAVSTFLSEYYLRHRGSRAVVVPLVDVERVLAAETVDLAVNVHSFSECRPEAIDWWLALLEARRVEYLMIVPNRVDHGGSALTTNDGIDFRPVVESHGYRLVAREPKYLDAVVQEYAINPTYHYLFRLGA